MPATNAAAIAAIVVTMTRERETKGAWLYKELDSDGDPVATVADGKLGQAYIRKSTPIGKAAPSYITVTVTVGTNPGGGKLADKPQPETRLIKGNGNGNGKGSGAPAGDGGSLPLSAAPKGH